MPHSRNQASPDPRRTLIEQCDAVLSYFKKADRFNQHIFAVHLATAWRFFLEEFKSPSAFATQPGDVQLKYVEWVLSLGETSLAEGREIGGMCSHLLAYYLAAIHTGDRDLEKALAISLDPIVKMGWEGSKAAGP